MAAGARCLRALRRLLGRSSLPRGFPTSPRSLHLKKTAATARLQRTFTPTWCAPIRNITACLGSRALDLESARGASGGGQSTGLFDCPEFSGAGGFSREAEKCIDRSRQLVALIASQVDSPNVSIVDHMDQLSDELCRVADLAECIRQVPS